MINQNFISIYDDILSKEYCDIIINEFESKLDRHRKGTVGNNVVKPKVKKSTDISYRTTNNCDTVSIILNTLELGINEYRNNYPDVDHIGSWTIDPLFNIQKYEPNEAYFGTHCECASLRSSKRVLAWMFYLNTINDNGGTRFPTYDLTINARMGRLVIWPAYWTHQHHGIVSETETKYIATGWHIFTET